METPGGAPPDDLSRIAPPREQPAVNPDPKTAEEIKKTRHKGPTAVDRHVASVALHIQDLTQQRERLQRERDRLQGELDWYRTEHARLMEANASATTGNILSGMLVALGGSVISGATFPETPTLRWALLTSGVALLVSGLVILIVSTIHNSNARRRSANRPAAGELTPLP